VEQEEVFYSHPELTFCSARSQPTHPYQNSNFEDVYLSFNRLHCSCSLIVARICTTLTAEKMIKPSTLIKSDLRNIQKKQ
jgi:hypothetical protein